MKDYRHLTRTAAANEKDPHGSGSAAIRPSSRRRRIQARLRDGRIFDAPPATPLGDILHVAGEGSPAPIIAAIVNGRLRELTAPLEADSDVTPLTMADADGMRIYRRSLAFLLLTAAAEVFPDAEIHIEHSATTSGAYFCEVRGRKPFTQPELHTIERRMHEIVAADAPIVALSVPLKEAMDVFRARREEDKARLLAHRERATVTLYELRGRKDHFGGFMVPSAGLLRYFGLHAHPPGFMLQFPRRSRPTELPPIRPYPKLFEAFEESSHWLDRLGIRSTGALNDAIRDGRLPEISLVGEALHEARIAQIALDIAERHDRIKVVLVAGPSSSGKTTFSKRLAVQLLANGVRPYPVSLDDYFVDRDRTPRDENNNYDYETIEALDLDLFNEHLLGLIEGRTVQLPHYSFATGRREPGPAVTLDSEHLVIVEGIHGLNPYLVHELPREKVFRIYVSALTQLNLDRHNRINTTDCRLIRRIVRDAATRGYNAAETLGRWDSVVIGEKQNIFPFQENCDAIFNSALVHELSILRPLADPLLLQVRPDTPSYLAANRLLALLQWFRPAPPDPVPSNSILREFVGGSILETYRLWPYD